MARAEILIDPGATTIMHVRSDGTDGFYEAVVLGIDGSDSVIPADTGNGLDVDVTRVPADPFGLNADAAVAAGAAGSIQAKLRRLTTDLGTVAGAVSGTEMQVDVITLPTVDTELPAAAALTDNFANPTAPGVGAFGMLWDGATWDRAAGNSAGGQFVQGPAAHDAAAAGGPVRIGFKAETTEPAVVADADAVDAWADEVGRQVVALWHPKELTPVTATLTATGDTSLIAAPGAGLSIYVCSILVTNTSATIARADFKDGSGGTTRVTGALAASGGGFMWTPLRPWSLTANTALFWAISASVTDVRCTVEYFVAA